MAEEETPDEGAADGNGAPVLPRGRRTHRHPHRHAHGHPYKNKPKRTEKSEKEI